MSDETALVKAYPLQEFDKQDFSIPLETDEFNAKSKSKVNEEDVSRYTKYKVAKPPYNVNNLAHLYEKSASQMAAVDTKVSGAVGLGFSLIEDHEVQDEVDDIEDPEEREAVRRIVDKIKKELFKTIEAMNGLDNFDETLAAIVTDLETIGNGYIEIGRNINGSIGYIGHIPAITMRVRTARDGFVQVVNDKATFFRNYGDRDTPDQINEDGNPNEIIHLKHYTPMNTYYGVPKVISALHAVAGEMFANQYNLDYFQHKAVPRHMIIVKNAEIGGESERNIEEFINTSLKGKHHRTLVVTLPPDKDSDTKSEITVEPIGANVDDSSFDGYHKKNTDEVMRANRTPIHMAGAASAASLGASRDSMRIFQEQVLRPIQLMLENKLKPVFEEITDMFHFKLNELTLIDEETMSRVDERHLRWGVKVPNDVRVRLGERRTDRGDQPMDMLAQAEARSEGAREQSVQASGNRQRDQERAGGADDPSSDRTRNPSGAGRQTD